MSLLWSDIVRFIERESKQSWTSDWVFVLEIKEVEIQNTALYMEIKSDRKQERKTCISLSILIIPFHSSPFISYCYCLVPMQTISENPLWGGMENYHRKSSWTIEMSSQLNPFCPTASQRDWGMRQAPETEWNPVTQMSREPLSIWRIWDMFPYSIAQGYSIYTGTKHGKFSSTSPRCHLKIAQAQLNWN